jgi:hypothetical protein
MSIVFGFSGSFGAFFEMYSPAEEFNKRYEVNMKYVACGDFHASLNPYMNSFFSIDSEIFFNL